MTGVDFGTVVREPESIGVDVEDAELLSELIERAKDYLQGFDWCRGIEETYFGVGVGGVVAVVLFRIRPERPDVDEWLWVVVGDVPSLYMVTDEASTPQQALRGYIELRDEWIAAVRAGASVDHLAPVNVPATPEWADDLDSRLRFIEKNILPREDY